MNKKVIAIVLTAFLTLTMAGTAFARGGHGGGHGGHGGGGHSFGGGHAIHSVGHHHGGGGHIRPGGGHYYHGGHHPRVYYTHHRPHHRHYWYGPGWRSWYWDYYWGWTAPVVVGYTITKVAEPSAEYIYNVCAEGCRCLDKDNPTPCRCTEYCYCNQYHNR